MIKHFRAHTAYFVLLRAGNCAIFILLWMALFSCLSQPRLSAGSRPKSRSTQWVRLAISFRTIPHRFHDRGCRCSTQWSSALSDAENHHKISDWMPHFEAGRLRGRSAESANGQAWKQIPSRCWRRKERERERAQSGKKPHNNVVVVAESLSSPPPPK